MKLQIVHTTQYKFDAPVYLEPHYIRLKPRIGSYVHLESFTIKVQPSEKGMREQFDPENNQIHFCWFEGLVESLTIKTSSVVRLNEYSPLNFLVYPFDFNKVPFEYGNEQKSLTGPSLNSVVLGEPILDFAENILKDSNKETVPFIINLTKDIHAQFVVESRLKGEPLEPNIVFQSKKGSCRDLSWMQINLLRHYGIAARFVSGYYLVQTENPVFELHGWIEAFIPGAGWLGADPSHGVITKEFHIPLAASAFPEYTMPVSGSIRGEADSQLVTDISIKQI